MAETPSDPIETATVPDPKKSEEDPHVYEIRECHCGNPQRHARAYRNGELTPDEPIFDECDGLYVIGILSEDDATLPEVLRLGEELRAIDLPPGDVEELLMDLARPLSTMEEKRREEKIAENIRAKLLTEDQAAIIRERIAAMSPEEIEENCEERISDLLADLTGAGFRNIRISIVENPADEV